MPKTKFKRNIHNLLLQELTEENEYIDLSDLPEYAFENRTYYICIIISASRVNLSHFPMNFVLFSAFFLFPKYHPGQYSVITHDSIIHTGFPLLCNNLYLTYNPLEY